MYDQDYAAQTCCAPASSEGAITGSVDTRVAVLDAMGADERSAT